MYIIFKMIDKLSNIDYTMFGETYLLIFPRYSPFAFSATLFFVVLRMSLVPETAT
jgi:hypothetical protein